MLGYPSGKFNHYTDFVALIHPEDSDRAMNAMRDLFDGILDKYEVEYRILTKSGEYKWFYVIGSVVKRDSTGRPLIITGIIIDITERKRIGENLRLSEERYKSLFQGNYSVMMIINPETGEIKDANPAACRYYGWTHTEMCSKNILDISILPSQDVIELMQKAKDEECNHFFSEHCLANGKIRNVEIYSGPINFKESIFLYSLIHDVTARKQAESELIHLNEELEDRVKERTAELLTTNATLRETKEKYRTVADFAFNWEFWTDQNDLMVYCSPSCERITGYKATEFVQNSRLLLDIIHPCDLNTYLNHKQNEEMVQDESVGMTEHSDG
jgi:PAS domain S-box-containing protein